jgi:predicted nucleic acid-binding protein
MAADRTILLDAGPLGMVTNPRRNATTVACAQWMQSHLSAGSKVYLPEIADYEIRRELMRAERTRGLASLDQLAEVIEYLPISTAAMREAARLWALARQQGRPTSHDRTIDADMILVGQALSLKAPRVVIATTNVGHLARFIDAQVWSDITVEEEGIAP